MTKLFYKIATGNVHFLFDGEPQVASCNCIITNEVNRVTVSKITEIHSGIINQLRTSANLTADNHTILNVSISSISDLGHMTKEEFEDVQYDTNE